MNDWHRAFVDAADFNLWQVEDLPTYAKSTSAAPLDRVGQRQIPRRVDGFVLRNDVMHGSLAHRYQDHKVWATALSALSGPWGPLLAEASAYGGNSTSEAPAHDFVLELDGEILPAPRWRMRRARRLRHAPIVNTMAQVTPLHLSTIDFAPREPDLPLICRAVRLQNLAPVSHRVALRCYIGLPDVVTRHCLLFSPDGAAGRHRLDYLYAEPNGEDGLIFVAEQRVLLIATDPSAQRFAIGHQEAPVWHQLEPGSPIAQVTDPTDGLLRLDLGELAPGEVKYINLYLTTGPDAAAARETLVQARAIGSEQLLRNTLTRWRKTYEAARVTTSDPRVTDLIDALADTTVQMRGTPQGHLRVGYYYNRALLKLGEHRQARANLQKVIEDWQQGGIVNEYHRFGAVSYWYDHAEIPQLLTMLVKDYHDWTGDDTILAAARPMVEDCMAFQTLTERHLQIMSGDETYRYCTVTDPWAENPDNSFAAACCLEWAARVWPEHQSDYTTQAANIRAAIDRFLVLPQGRYAHYITASGWRDERPIADILLRPLLLGYAPRTDPVVRSSVEDVWRYNRIPEGTITTDPAFYLNGQGACLMLQSLAELDSSAAEEYFWAFVNSAPATGGWWEYTDNEDTTKSGGRLLGPEPLPSALEGLLHYLIGHKPVPDGLEIAPHLPSGLDWVNMDGFMVHGEQYDLHVRPDGLVLSRAGQHVVSADRLLRLVVTKRLLTAWPMIPTPPYPDVSPLRLVWEEGQGWHITPSPSLGTVTLTFCAGRHRVRYEQKCDDNGIVLTLTNLDESTCTCRVGKEARMLAGQACWTLQFPAALDSTIAWALLTVHHQRMETVEPGDPFLLQGRVSRIDGAPMQGAVDVHFGDGNVRTALDKQGCFCIRLKAPMQVGTHLCLIHCSKSDAPAARATIQVNENPLTRLDDLIGDWEPAAALVAASETTRKAALWVWQEILCLKQVSLPVYETIQQAGHTRNLIVFGDLPGVELSAPLTEGNGFAIHRSPWHPERVLIHVPDSSSGDVREMVHGFVHALQLHIRRLARQYRAPEPNEAIAIYEFNACHRDWQVAARFGARPRQALEVEIEAVGAETYIGNTTGRHGLLELDKSHDIPKLVQPYVRVHTTSTHSFTATVGVECDAPELLPVTVRLRAPQGVKMIWIPDISYYWVTGLAPTCHYDGGQEVARVWREADGAQVVEISLRPGTPIRPVLRYPPHGWTPQYASTYRRMEVVFSDLSPRFLVEESANPK